MGDDRRCGANNVVYLIGFCRASKVASDSDALLSADFKTGSEFWSAFTSTPHTADHSLIMYVDADGCSAVVQSYFGYYSINSWLAFDQPLSVLGTLPQPTQSARRHTLDAQPKFRGPLDAQKGRELSHAVDMVTRNSSVRDYCDITGVAMPRLPPVTTIVIRLDRGC